ncbi:MAG: T9SS type A sorting domain-containing protein [Candidatus Cloacimonas sp.]
MKQILTVILVGITALLMAQYEIPFGNIRHSSRDENGNIHLRWEDLSGGTLNPDFLYSANDAPWQNSPIQDISTGEKEALAPYTFGQKLRYRLHYSIEEMGESIAMMQSAYWDSDTFPPQLNKMAYIATDAEGDSVTVYSQNLDLRESYTAISSDKIYFSMQNLSGNFPIMNSLTSYNVYLGVLGNVSSLMDSVGYAMIYSFNIPGVVSSGLYKVGYDSATQMPVFTRLGNVQSQVSGGALNLACNISDLTADPDFGSLPDALLMLGLTLKVDIDLANLQPQIGLGDYSTPAYIIFQDNNYQVSQNTAPVCTFNSYDPFTELIQIDYLDADDDFPLLAETELPDGTILQFVPTGVDYALGVTYTVQLPDVNIPYITWRFSDNGFDIVQSEFHLVANQDENIVPTKLSCSLPNPVYSFPVMINLKGLSAKPINIEIYNVKGQKVVQLHNPKAENGKYSVSLNRNQLGSGVYFMKVENGSQTLKQKFVVVK